MCMQNFGVVKDEPKVVYERFEKRLLDSLPADQPEFIKLLEKEGVVGEKTRRKINTANQKGDICAPYVLQEIDISPFPKEKFNKLLSVMKGYKHDLQALVQEVEDHLDPGINACINT